MPEDLAEIYRSTFPALVRFLYRKVWDVERAEDLAQEAFARAVDEAVHAETERSRVRTALEQLTPRDREVLLLWDAGLSYDEIATQTGLARGAVGTTLARARRRLVEAFAAGERDEHIARG